VGEIMKIKTLTLIIILVMLGSIFATSANNVKSNIIDNKIKNSNIIKEIDIRVAIYTDEKESDPEFYSPYGRTRYFMFALDYDWQVGDRTYNFVPTLLTTKDILRKKLTTDNFDVFLYPPDTADQFIFTTGISILPRNIIRERKIANFIGDGGGFFGTCGGAIIAGDITNKPKTFLERIFKNTCLEISDVDIEYKTTLPLFSQIIGLEPESLGIHAYLFYSGWNASDMNIVFHSGACLDINISKNNPIFDGLMENTRKIRWISSPPFEIPIETDGEINIIARFPEDEISDNKTIDIHHWKYIGGIRNLIKGLFYRGGEIHWLENLGIGMKAFVFAGDWIRDKPVKTNHSNRPFAVTEIYPNKNNSRIVRFSGHPEYNIWWGGHIEETDDTDNNNIYEGFHHWVDIKPENETIEDEFSYNYWIVRRSIAWAAKVPDNDLPPVYGPSEVSDIYPYEQTSPFLIEGNAKTEEGIMSLDLYYRYSPNNETLWTNWTNYNTDTNRSDGWSWKFDCPYGTGYYQFYSLRHVKHEYEWMNEIPPPGPDTISYIVIE
jgi:hypothetical protein